MNKETIKRFQALLAIAGLPANTATAEVLLELSGMVDEDQSIDKVLDLVDKINAKYIAEPAINL